MPAVDPLTAIPAVAELALGAAAPAIASLGYAAKTQRKQLREDAGKMRAGKLGMSDAERAQAGRDVQRQLEAQAKGAEDQLRREGAASGFGRSGAQQKAMGDLQAQKLEASAKGMGTVDAASAQLAEQRKAQVLARIKQQADQNRQNWMDAVGAATKPTSLGDGNYIPPAVERVIQARKPTV